METYGELKRFYQLLQKLNESCENTTSSELLKYCFIDEEGDLILKSDLEILTEFVNRFKGKVSAKPGSRDYEKEVMYNSLTHYHQSIEREIRCILLYS